MKNRYFEKISIIMIIIVMLILFIYSGIKCIVTNFNIDYIILLAITLGFMGVIMFMRLLYDRTH